MEECWHCGSAHDSSACHRVIKAKVNAPPSTSSTAPDPASAYCVETSAPEQSTQAPVHCGQLPQGEKNAVEAEKFFNDVRTGKKKQVRESLKRNGTLAHVEDAGGNRPLHIACEDGRIDIAILLLQHGADTHSKNKENTTALHIATIRGEFPLVRELLKNGASPADLDGDEYNSLYYAITQERELIVKGFPQYQRLPR